jgi:hypothetical protein
LTFMLARKRLGNQAGAGRAYAAVERPATYRRSPPVESGNASQTATQPDPRRSRGASHTY